MPARPAQTLRLLPKLAEPEAPGPAPDSEAALAEYIRAERVRFVFIQSAIPIFFSPIASTILALALWHAVGHSLLVAWTSGLWVIAALRVWLIRAYPLTNPGVPGVRRWERTFVGSILVVDLWWGLGALTLLVPDALPERGLVFCFLMLMASGHASSYAAHPATVLLGVLALAGPVTLAFALHDDTFHRAMALAAVMYLLATFRSIRTLGYFFGRTHRLAHELQQERDRAERLARVDFLTQLNNRRAFFELGQAALSYAERYAHPTALLMLDIDHFKAINDRHGHAAGDAALRALAELLQQGHRSTDVMGRLGGEEFAVLLPETRLEEALALAERLRASVRVHALEHAGAELRFTASVGVAARQPGEALEQLLARADAALYQAKHAGRDRVVAAGD